MRTLFNEMFGDDDVEIEYQDRFGQGSFVTLDDKFAITVELAGFKKKCIAIQLDPCSLTVRAIRSLVGGKIATVEKGITFPRAINPQATEAFLRDGELLILAPFATKLTSIPIT